MSDLAIALEAGWEGDPSKFVAALTSPDFRLLDGEPGCWRIHDWEKINPYCAGHAARVEAARAAGKASAAKRVRNAPLKTVDRALTTSNEASTPPLPPTIPPTILPTTQPATDQAPAPVVDPAPESPESLWLRKIQEVGSVGRGGLLSPESARLLAIRGKLQWSDVLAVLADPKCANKNWRYIAGYLERVASEPKSPGSAPITAADEAKRERDRKEALRQRAAMEPLSAAQRAAGIAKLKAVVGGVFPGATVEVCGEDGKE
jgi:hypothetical protein